MLINLPRPDKFQDRLALCVATLGPAGRMPGAPGTWGSLAAAILAVFVLLPLPIWARLALLALIAPLGAVCATRAEQILGRKDPSCVVVDELWGQWIAALLLPADAWLWLGPAFVFFRLFDIAKPWPVRASEQWLPDGWGVMLDDGLAGLYALALVSLCRLLW